MKDPKIDQVMHQISVLSKAVSLTIYALQRGPAWGATGEVYDLLSEARRYCNEVRDNLDAYSKL